MGKKRYKLADSFRQDTSNDGRFKGFSQLNDEELKLFERFINGFIQDWPLPGRNKESWLDSTNTPIPGTEDYQRLNIWHYHCGPFAASATGAPFTHKLQRNLRGETSAAVIHYRKVDDDTIIILAFSPEHIPFPQLDLNETP